MRNKYTDILLTFLFALFTVTGCISDPEMPDDIRNAKAPEVTTGSISDVAVDAITISGEVVFENGAKVTERGWCWSKTTPVTLETATSKKLSGEGKGVFEERITDLEESTTYYIVAYARNVAGIAYGGEPVEFATIPGKVIVETDKPESVNFGAEWAECGGNITFAGEGEISERGVYYALSAADLQNETNRERAICETDVLVYQCQLSGLTASTTYYYQAFVTNDFGTSTGAVESFTTTDGLPVVSKVTVVEKGFSNASVLAELISAGESDVLERGFCYSSENELPGIDDLSAPAILNPEAPFEALLEDLEAKTYYVRAYAKNRFGICYSDESESFDPLSRYPSVTTLSVGLGGRDSLNVSGAVTHEGANALLSAGMCWSTEPNPTVDETLHNFVELTTRVEAFEGSVFGLKPNTTYYVRAYASNSLGTGYGEEMTVQTPPFIQVLAAYSGNNEILPTTTYFSLDDGCCYFLGGYLDSNKNSNAFWKYEPRVNNWKQEVSFPVPLSRTTSVALGSNCVVFGGLLDDNIVSDATYSYSSYGWYLNTVTGDRPNPTYEAMGASPTLNDEQTQAYFVGGIQEVDDTRFATDEVWIYTLSEFAWTRGVSLPISQYDGLCVAIGSKIYAGLGQERVEFSSFKNKLWSFDTANPAAGWVEETAFPSTNNFVAGVAFEGVLYVIDSAGQIYKYDPQNKEWTAKSVLTSSYRQIHVIYVINDNIYFGFGETGRLFISYSPLWDN